MIEQFIIAAIPTAITGVVAFIIGKRQNASTERVTKARAEADVQIKALDIVKGIIQDLKDEFLRELKVLKSENEELKNSIKELEAQLVASSQLTETLRGEINSLRNTLKTYQEENERLKNQ